MADDLSERLVDSMAVAYGSHPGYRAAHAVGVLCAGSFTPSPGAAAISRAPQFAGPPVRAHVRFSNGSGDPGSHDGNRDGRGMAVKLYVPDGSTTDMVGLSLPVFFVRTPEDLLAFNNARRPDPATGQPDTARAGAFIAEHPEVMGAINAAIGTPPPSSYAGLTYNSIHVFRYVGVDGTERAARYHWIPEQSGADLDDADALARSPRYLSEELAARLDAGPIAFGLELEMAADGDPVDDPTAIWDDGRERVPMGQLEITGLAFDRERDGDVLVFDPTRVPDGIRLTDDPILRARSGAYSVSVARRTSSG